MEKFNPFGKQFTESCKKITGVDPRWVKVATEPKEILGGRIMARQGNILLTKYETGEMYLIVYL